MIVRISSEGQFRLDGAHLDRLNELDNQIVERVAKDDEQGFAQLFQQMLAYVRQQGTPLGAEEFVESDVVVPPPETTLEEARHLFQGEGLISG